MMAGSNREFDIVIAGGGMIGTSLALALAPLGLRIAVVEPIPVTTEVQPSFDDRTTALSRSSQRLFEALGLWDRIVAASTPIRKIHVSDKGRFGFAHIDAEEQRVEALGYVVVNRVLGQVLRAAMAKEPQIELLCPASITAIRLESDRAFATVGHADGQSTELGCKLLVAADGARSSVREMMGISVQHADYGQRAVVGNLRPGKPIDNIAYERFTESGPLAMLPFTDDRAAFIWTVSEQDAARILGLDDQAFVAELQSVFGYRLGTLGKVGKRAGYPLFLSKALRLIARRSVVVGNAAHGLHPVAAQGFNLGLRDVAALCDCIADAINADEDQQRVGEAVMLERYAEWRRSDQRKLVGFTDGLIRLFAHRRGPLRTVRNVGMLGFDLIPGLRNEFARQTMGLAGRLPRLSRGVPLR